MDSSEGFNDEWCSKVQGLTEWDREFGHCQLVQTHPLPLSFQLQGFVETFRDPDEKLPTLIRNGPLLNTNTLHMIKKHLAHFCVLRGIEKRLSLHGLGERFRDKPSFLIEELS